MRKFLTSLACFAGLTLAMLPAQAALVMPTFADVPTGWVTDRYDPDVFANVGTYQGRDNVLGIGISRDDGLSTRPAAYQSTFYNTQGRQHAVAGGAGSVLSAALWISEEWANPQNGHARTDMWGVMGGGSALDYTIVGFTNYGGAGRLRIWDDETANGWVDLGMLVNYGTWVDLAIEFTGSSYKYLVDDVVVYTDNTINGSTGFSAVLMQAYNFCGDTSIQGANCSNYMAHWSNTQASAVPTPASLPLAMLALGALGVVTLRSRRNAKA